MPLPLAGVAVPVAAGAVGFGGGFLAGGGVQSLVRLAVLSAIAYGAFQVVRAK